MQPELVNVHRSLILELLAPFSAVLVLGILPFSSYALFEEMVI
jgi:hypothetical protein